MEVKVSDVLTKDGGEVEFLKRRYVATDQGVYMFSNNKHTEGLIEAVGDLVKERDTPADQSFLEPDESKELSSEKAKVFKECVGRLLYLSHSRPDLQFATCVLSSKMARPTQTSWKWLLKTVGYLVKAPSYEFLIKPIRDNACYGWNGGQALEPSGTIVIESVTDSDWAGCKRSRKSKSSLQIFVGGSLVTSAVRTQKSISLSSGEAEFVAMVSGACEARYVKDCLEYMVKGNYNVEARLRGDSAAGRGIAQRVGCGRVRHLDAGLLWLQQAVKERMFKVGAIAGTANPSDLGTKPVPAARLRELLFKLGAVDESYELVGKAEHEEAAARRSAKELFKNSGTGIRNIKQIMPILLILSQIQGIEGLSLVAGFENYTLEDIAVIFVTTAIGLLAWSTPNRSSWRHFASGEVGAWSGLQGELPESPACEMREPR